MPTNSFRDTFLIPINYFTDEITKNSTHEKHPKQKTPKQSLNHMRIPKNNAIKK
jgi:hypothetical protein